MLVQAKYDACRNMADTDLVAGPAGMDKADTMAAGVGAADVVFALVDRWPIDPHQAMP